MSQLSFFCAADTDCRSLMSRSILSRYQCFFCFLIAVCIRISPRWQRNLVVQCCVTAQYDVNKEPQKVNPVGFLFCQQHTTFLTAVCRLNNHTRSSWSGKQLGGGTTPHGRMLKTFNHRSVALVWLQGCKWFHWQGFIPLDKWNLDYPARVVGEFLNRCFDTVLLFRKWGCHQQLQVWLACFGFILCSNGGMGMRERKNLQEFKATQ